MNKKIYFWLVLLLIVLAIGLYIAIKSGSQTEKGPPPTPVMLGEAVTKNMPVYLNGLGSVVPTANITVHTQINGTLLQVFFHEGQMVKAGDVLAQVDPRPYQAQLLQYQGQLQRDQALLANAKLDLMRYQTLLKQKAVSTQTFTAQQSLVAQDQGAILIDQGLIQATQLNLTYARITSPVAGRVGLRLIDPGNQVQTSDANGIAVITTLDPITVIFSLPENNIPDILSALNQGKNINVFAFNSDGTHQLGEGTLITVDNQMDPTTGTVRLRARFNNAQNQLFPNQFVNVRLLLRTLNNAVTIPTMAVQYGANGTFVYVYDPAMHKVKVSHITVSVTEGEDTVVTSGVQPHQRVVIEGADNLTGGETVRVLNASTKKAHAHARAA